MMRAFSELFEELDTTTATSLKVAALTRYFSTAAPADAAPGALVQELRPTAVGMGVVGA